MNYKNFFKRGAALLLLCLAALATACGSNAASNVMRAIESPGPLHTEIQAGEDDAGTPGANTKLGTFKTEFSKDATNRNINIQKAAESLNGVVVPAGGTFSFNESVGPANAASGYKKAQIFVNGRKSKGFGGGICQVSSTLYNAALDAGVEIVERHPHSLPVDYVPEGKDAATSYGSSDFKFKNTHARSIKIETKTTETSVETTLYSV